MKKNNSGITLLVLVITIVVLTIIASITVYEGKELINKSKIQTLETNMLTIQAKAKAYAEEIEAKIWVKEGDDKESARNTEFQSKKFTNSVSVDSSILNQVNEEVISDGYYAYTVTGEALTDMGLDDINTETYIVVYNSSDCKKIDIIFPEGIKYNKKSLYTLSEIHKELTK